MSQNFGDLALLRGELSHDLVRKKLRAFAQRRQRGLELVRHVAQKAILLLLELGEALSHPVQTLAEVLQVLGSADQNRRAEIGLPQPANRLVDLADRTRDQNREADDQKDHDRKQCEELP